MRFLLVIIAAPFLIVPLAAISFQMAACDMHVTAVDGMRDKRASAERQGWFYSYCSLWQRVDADLGDARIGAH